MDAIVNEPKVSGAIADFNAQQVPEEIKNVTVNLEEIGKSLSSNEPSSTITSGGKEITQVVPSEVKKEELEKVEVTKTEKKETTPAVVPPKEEAKKRVSSVLKAPVETEVKKEEVPIAPKEEFTPKIKPITPIREEKKEEFNYDGYAPQEVTNMKNMSRQSREAYAGLLKENRELSKLKDGLYMQSEGAYTLSPEYRQIQQKGFLATNEAQAWEKALLDIKQARPFKPPVGIDPKTGQVILGQEMQPSDQFEIQVGQYLQRCHQVLGQIENEVSSFPQRYKQQVGMDLQAVRDTQRNLFAWHTDPKLLDYKLDVEGVGERTLAQIKQDIKSMWPVYMQSHPAIDVLGDMMISLRIRDRELHEARKGQKTAEIEREEVKRGEPSSSAAPDSQSGKSSKKNGMPDIFGEPPSNIRL